MEASVSGFVFCARAEFVNPEANKTENMAADASANFHGFSLVYSMIFSFEPLQFGKFTSSRMSLLMHSSFSEIKVRQHFLSYVNCIFLRIKKASIASNLISFVVKQGGEHAVIIPL